jgi:phosphoribosylformylglycinamidine synthase subunit PurS
MERACQGARWRWRRVRAGYNRLISLMKARVYVSFKPTVLDPQGQTIHHALNGLGHKSIAGVRQGKYFEIELAPGSVKEQVAKEMDQIARDVLANPVMEDYKVEFLD